MQISFVLNLGPQISERPRVMLPSLSFPNPYPVADAGQFFYGDPSTGAFGSQHQFLGDAMIHVIGKAVLFASVFLEKSAARLRSLLLQLTSQFVVALAQTVDSPASVDIPV